MGDWVRQAKADFTVALSCPHSSMAPVPAISGMVADRHRFDGVLTPLESFINQSQPGRVRSISHTANRNGREKERVVAEPDTEKGTAATSSVPGPGAGSSAPRRRRDRCGQQRPLRSDAPGSRCRAGAPVRVLHRRPASDGGLVTQLRREDGGDAIHGCLLDSDFRHPGSARVSGLPGQCASHEELAGAEKRRAGVPVGAEVASYGLLGNFFHPTAEIRVLRSYRRQRGDQVRAIGMCIQRMQKALTQMNVQLANVKSDLSGVIGQRIVRAILAGDRDPGKLAELADPRIRASQKEIVRSLDGTWQPELLFVLKQEMAMYDVHQERVVECDRELRTHLKGFADRTAGGTPETKSTVEQPTKAARTTKRNKKTQGHAPDFKLGGELQRISGVDLTGVDGIDVMVAQTIISEVGLDMSRWKNEAHFASWLGLCPDNRISGDRVLGKGTRHVVNRAATALRMAAITMLRSKSYLGAQYRRLRTKLGAPKALTAMAHRLARLAYRMLKYGQEYVDKGMQYYDERYRKQQIDMLEEKAAKLGRQVLETPAA